MVIDNRPTTVDDEKCLRQLLKDMQKLATMESLADVVLVCGAEEIKAHKSILAARSSVFEAMFSNEMLEKQTGEVKIDNCQPDELRDFLYFLYAGKLETHNNVEGLLNLASFYQVDTLKEICEIYLMNKISKENALEILILANLYDSKYGLKQKAFHVIKTEVLGPSCPIPDDCMTDYKKLERIIETKASLDELVNA